MKQHAFTLVELLIVIAIIGILAAVLVPNLVAARGKANDTATLSYVRNCYVALETARNVVTGALPTLPVHCSSLPGGGANPASTPLGGEVVVLNGTPHVRAQSVTGTIFRYDGNTWHNTLQ